MTYSCCLSESVLPLVLDTSALINLRESGYGARLLSALPNSIIVPEIVASELDPARDSSIGCHHFFRDFVAAGNITLATLSDEELKDYERLVSMLDDGEAATIAIAGRRGYLPIIDEHKGRLVAQDHCQDVAIGWSLDLFRHPKVLTALGLSSIDALYRALREGRMRVNEGHCEEVVKLIGLERAMQCTCLPGYKKQFPLWQDALRSQLLENREKGEE